MPNTAISHLAAIQSLTPVETREVASDLVTNNAGLSLLFSPLLPYAVIILFFAIFIAAIGFQIAHRILDWKKTATSFVIALLIATFPLGVRTVFQTTSLSSRASSDEVPRNIEVTQLTPDSVEVSWQTTAEKLGAVRVGKSPLTEINSTTVIADSGKKNRNHTTKLMNLEKGVMYEFEILSGSSWYSNEGKPIQILVK